ncbi:MAG: LysR substrate-binding domain-containing protein [Paracoccaceae bacterium]
MPERIAHLSALRVFAVAARTLSFKDAAGRLGLTPAAVSYQIRTLEAYLGQRLFERHARRIELTEAGRALAPALDDAFRAIALAVGETRALTRPAHLRVSVGPAIAAKWLVPRVWRFGERHPALTLDVSVSTETVDLDHGSIDVAIRHGRGDYPGVDCVRLFGEAYAPVCAPALARRLATPGDLAGQRLLHDDAAAYPGPTSGWADWLAACGLDPALAAGGQRFAQSDHAIQAAIDGAGVLLGRLSLAAGDLAAGRLVRPFETALPSPFAYYLVTAKGRLGERPIAALLDWLREEAGGSGLA